MIQSSKQMKHLALLAVCASLSSSTWAGSIGLTTSISCTAGGITIPSSCGSPDGQIVGLGGLGPSGVGGLNTTDLTASLLTQSQVSVSPHFQPGDGVSILFSAMLELNVYTEGPVRPGYLQLNAFADGDGGQGSGVTAGLDVADGLYEWHPIVTLSPSLHNVQVPIMLGTGFSIVLLGSSSSSSAGPFGTSGGGGISMSLEAIDPNFCAEIGANCTFSVPVTVSEAPEPATLALSGLAFAALFGLRRSICR
jgi:hypothetical protein